MPALPFCLDRHILRVFNFWLKPRLLSFRNIKVWLRPWKGALSRKQFLRVQARKGPFKGTMPAFQVQFFGFIEKALTLAMTLRLAF